MVYGTYVIDYIYACINYDWLCCTCIYCRLRGNCQWLSRVLRTWRVCAEVADEGFGCNEILLLQLKHQEHTCTVKHSISKWNYI